MELEAILADSGSDTSSAEFGVSIDDILRQHSDEESDILPSGPFTDHTGNDGDDDDDVEWMLAHLEDLEGDRALLEKILAEEDDDDSEAADTEVDRILAEIDREGFRQRQTWITETDGQWDPKETDAKHLAASNAALRDATHLAVSNADLREAPPPESEPQPLAPEPQALSPLLLSDSTQSALRTDGILPIARAEVTEKLYMHPLSAAHLTARLLVTREVEGGMLSPLRMRRARLRLS